MAEIEDFLKLRAGQGLLRALRPAAWRKPGVIRFGRREYIDFSSNDYLGLSGHPKLKQSIREAVDRFGTANPASRLMSGDLELYHQLEEKIACFKNKEAGLLFNSGYQANTGIISALYGRGDCIFCDRLAHASLMDGIILSRAKFWRFTHNDPNHLEAILKKQRSRFKNALIVTESVFSMDGDKAPLKELAQLKERYDCAIFVDEAHATGIFGRNGSGLVEEAGLTMQIDFIMGTFSKALAGFGAYLAASKKIVDYLVNTCRSFIYSTALPPAVIACNLQSLALIKEEPQRRKRLLRNAAYFRAGLKERGLHARGDTQIVPLIIGDSAKAVEFSRKLEEKGYWVPAVRPPTVPATEARLRFSLTACHGKEILTRLIEDICNIGL
ncbi:MAG: 8-amino-7-oxononanoate synthase [Candidatus Omnitrophota bacterium]|nr:8-amino-7-oxononanoate synthase [Candidatus Omnitrophota bacterium]